jgi:hypothetical protein
MIFFEALGFATLAALIALGLGIFIHYISDYEMGAVYGLSLGVWLGNFVVYLIKFTQ